MTDAKSIHRRAGVLPKQSVSTAKVASQVVPVKFNPENPPQEEFKEFYPLHVTKVEAVKKVSPLTLVLWSILAIAVAAVAGLYVLSEQQKKEAALSASSTSSSSTTTTALNQPAVTETLTPANPVDLGTVQAGTDGAIKYTNATYAFELSLPASWAQVTMTDATDSITTEITNQPQALIDYSVADAAGTKTRLLQLRIDTVVGFAAWADSLNQLQQSVPTKLLANTQYVVTTSYKALADAKVTGSSDIDTILKSIAAYAAP